MALTADGLRKLNKLVLRGILSDYEFYETLETHGVHPDKITSYSHARNPDFKDRWNDANRATLDHYLLMPDENIVLHWDETGLTIRRQPGYALVP